MTSLYRIRDVMALALFLAVTLRDTSSSTAHRSTSSSSTARHRSHANDTSRNGNFYSPPHGGDDQTHHHRSHHHGEGRGGAGDSEDAALDSDRSLSGGTNCSVCPNSERDVKRSYRIESIKADILRKLHLRSPPNVTGMQLPALPHIQRFIDQVNHSYPPQDDEDDGATTMRVIQVSKLVPTERVTQRYSQNTICYFTFPMSEVRTPSQIVSLVFGIYVRSVNLHHVPGEAARSTYVLIYLLMANNRTLLRKKRITLTPGETGKWYTFTLRTEEIQHWISTPEMNYGLLVQGSDGRGEPITVVVPQNADEEPLRPYLQVEMSERSTVRSKRTMDNDCAEGSADRHCCRYPLTVDFDAFHWDWVIVPKRYSAFYCSGECPYLFVQQFGHGLTHLARPEGAGGPCCSPRKVSAISMLYYDEHMNIIYGRLPGMVVDRCGCA